LTKARLVACESSPRASVTDNDGEGLTPLALPPPARRRSATMGRKWPRHPGGDGLFEHADDRAGKKGGGEINAKPRGKRRASGCSPRGQDPLLARRDRPSGTA